MTRTLALLVALATPALAAAQERDAVQTDYIALRGGGSLPVFGRAYTDLDGRDVDYHRMVRSGMSGSLEMGALFRTPHNFALGGYLDLGFASHPGDEVASSVGTYDFNSFDMARATGGLRFIGGSGSGISLEAFAGGGVIVFEELDADFTPTGLPLSAEVEVFNRTLRGLGTGGVRIGVGGDGFSVQLGLSGMITHGPRFDSLFINDGRGGTIIVAQADLGIQIGF